MKLVLIQSIHDNLDLQLQAYFCVITTAVVNYVEFWV